jgi:hypothetical protein
VLGAIALLGAIGVLDLRVLGYGHRLEPQALARATIPLAVGGFVALLLSGSVLFAADASALVASPVFLAKVALIALGVLNVLVFHRLRPPWGLAARLSALTSLLLWTAVVVLGRLIAYV